VFDFIGSSIDPPSRCSQSLTQLIQPTWPLQRWGLDLLGPLPPAQGNLKYVVVAVEYFSKWIETKPLATITSAIVQKFFWQNIVCRFDVPKCWGLVLKCYELRTRQHRMLNVNVLRPTKHYSLGN
jgi:hypothetical protein